MGKKNSPPTSAPPAYISDSLLTDRELANYLRLKPITLRIWRSARRGLPYIRVGRRNIRYRFSDVQQWLDSNREVRE